MKNHCIFVKMSSNPHVIEEEHAWFHRRVTEIIDSESNCWNYFVELMKTMERHQQLEEMIVIPLLTFVEYRMLEKHPENTSSLDGAYRKLLEHYDTLISEHTSMKKILKDIKGETYLVEVSNFIDDILHHIRMEEEMAYPAAIAAGQLLNLDLSRARQSTTRYRGAELPL